MTGRCPTPGKKAYHTKGEAEAAIRAIKSNGDRREAVPERSYRCACGKYHLTSAVMPPSKSTKWGREKRRRRGNS